MYSDMSMRTSALSSSNRKEASALVSSVLPTPVGPRNMNEPMGRFGSCRPARARRTAVESAGHRLVLADDAARDLLLHLEELLALAFEHLVDGHAGPAHTTCATCLAVTASSTSTLLSWLSASSSFFSSSGIVP